MSIQELMKHAEITQRQQGSRRITQEQRERMERDAMAWQVFVAKSTEYNYSDTEAVAETMAKHSYMYADAFLAERKRQAQEGGE